MGSHLIDSPVFGHLWATDESRALFSDVGRIERWLQVLAALARSQAELGIIPASSAAAIATLDARAVDLDAVAAGTRQTSHSTLGFIRVLQELLPSDAAEHVYYGITVQDLTDTATALEIDAVGRMLFRDLVAIEADLVELAEQHRDTPMVGRTHGQPGAPITFGFKAASWCDEIGRAVDRLAAGRSEWVVGQLGGAVGTLAFFGDDALALRASFCRHLGLGEPDISWLTARDRLGDFAACVALAVTGLARLANEVYVLQRRELGEVLEPTSGSTVGSITMPHKRNPEISEQVVTLARLVRTQAALLADTMVQEHERDGRGWKAEWVAFPELAHYGAAAAALSRQMVAGLEVVPEAMLANLRAAGDTTSEHLLALVSARLGKHRAQAVLNDAYRVAASTGRPLAEVLASELTTEELAELDVIDVGAAGPLVDRVVRTARRRRDDPGCRWG